jgi:dihydropteroate synthase
LSGQSNSISIKKTLLIDGHLLDLSQPRLMGILNTTPDSFYSGSRLSTEHAWLNRTAKMLEDGADIIDVGGYSTRPGAAEVAVHEEIERVLPVVRSIKKHYPEAILSVDTFRASVAETCLDNGANIINDVSGGRLDKALIPLVARRNIPYVIMHMRGTPQSMNQLNFYEDLITDIIYELQEMVDRCIAEGIADLIIDPGFGFAKNTEQNFELMRQLKAFQRLGHPVLVGISRKSTIYKTLNTTPEGALNGTTAMNMMALMNEASILRVHDIKEASECIKLYKSVYL